MNHVRGTSHDRKGGRTPTDRSSQALLAALVALCDYIKPAETLPGGFSDVKVTDSHLNGKTLRGLRLRRSWVGDDLRVVAPRQRDRDGHTWAFKSWSDGGPATHVIDAPPADAPEGGRTFTANFRKVSR